MKNFIIVGTQRTGSSAIAENLGLHSQITCGWEWTQKCARSHKLTIAKEALQGDFSHLDAHDRSHMQKVFRKDADWLGFRRLFRSSDKWLLHPSFSPALFMDRLNDHLTWFSGAPDIHIIHVVRKNNIEWLKSKFLSGKTKSFVEKAYPEDMKVDIPLREAQYRLRAKNWVDSRLSLIENTTPYIRVYYEDFCANPDETMTRLFNFLSAPELDIDQSQKRLFKQSTGDASQYISNYAQLLEKLNKNNLLISNCAEDK
ncbi:sulfotransferase [Pseudomonadota bacterium]